MQPPGWRWAARRSSAKCRPGLGRSLLAEGDEGDEVIAPPPPRLTLFRRSPRLCMHLALCKIDLYVCIYIYTTQTATVERPKEPMGKTGFI